MSNRSYCYTLQASVIEAFLPTDWEDTEEFLICWGTSPDKFDDIPTCVDGKPLIRYNIMQLERAPTTGTLHFQGFIQLNEKLGRKKLIELVPWLMGAHLEGTKGTDFEGRNYCAKSQTRVAGPWEYGQFYGQGHRSDVDSVIDLIRTGATEKQVAETMPGTYIRMHAGISKLISITTEAPKDPNFEPRAWQKDILDKIKEEADDRHIIWVSDTVGGKGKSRLTKHLICEHKALCLQGQLKDMIYAFINQPAPIVVFDVSRAQAEYSSHLYTMAENLKNGFLFNSKYQSAQLTFKPPHVIFFSNALWDQTKWSAGRVIHINLDNNQINQDQRQALRFM